MMIYNVVSMISSLLIGLICGFLLGVPRLVMKYQKNDETRHYVFEALESLEKAGFMVLFAFIGVIVAFGIYGPKTIEWYKNWYNWIILVTGLIAARVILEGLAFLATTGKLKSGGSFIMDRYLIEPYKDEETAVSINQMNESAYSVIDKAIRENRHWEILLYVFSVLEH